MVTTVLRTASALVAIGVLAQACGGGAGVSTAPGRLAVRAAVRRSACLPGRRALLPYRGTLVLVSSDGRRSQVKPGRDGAGRISLAPGRYRLVPPLRGSTVRLELDGRPVAGTGGYPVHISAGRTATLAVAILPRRGECTSSGAGA